jgi:hypothetical protein
MKRSKPKNNRGQAMVELILVTVLFLAITSFVANVFKQNELFLKLVATPWQKTQGMAQNGVWGSIDETNGKHPALTQRVTTPRPED